MRSPAEAKLMLVLAEITRCAEAGEPCPSNGEINALVGGRSDSTGYRILHALGIRDLVKVERVTYGRRIVTITETGKSTAMPPAMTRTGKVVTLPIAERPEHVFVDRNPCTYCGVNPAHGCKHRERIAA